MAAAANFRAVFDEGKVLITMRHPISLTGSFYFQNLKRDSIGVDSRWGVMPGRQPIETWLADGGVLLNGLPMKRPLKTLLEYAETISIWTHLLGRDSVGVFVFEDMVEDQNSYVERICRFIGIDPEEGVRLTDSRHSHARWTLEQMARIEAIESSFWQSLRFRFSSRKQRQGMVGRETGDLARNAPTASARIPDAYIALIEDMTREGNRWLANEFSLDLERHGYPL